MFEHKETGSLAHYAADLLEQGYMEQAWDMVEDTSGEYEIESAILEWNLAAVEMLKTRLPRVARPRYVERLR